ncbi:hypothetical protein AB0H20_27520 [Nocardia fluminea]|uniref:hypothetical protein n=1 Tax=Nocardia fluminea TaxID=134984 RepID=UPI0033EAF726
MAIPAKSSHGSFADPDIQVEESADIDLTDADLASEEAQLPPPTHWQRVAGYLLSDPTRRYLPYAAVAAAAVCAGIGILIATGTNSDAADDATALSGKASDSQSFDDPSALLPGYETITGATESGLPEVPGDIPLPGEELGIDPAAVEGPLGSEPVTVTQTESGYPIGGDPVLTDDPVLTETAAETPAPTTVTETSSGTDWPNVSLNGSVTVPSPAPGTTVTETPASTPSTVTVIVTPTTVRPTPSTVTVVVPAETTTTAPQRTTTAPKPTTCRTATPSTTPKAPKAITTPPLGTPSSRPTTTTKPQATAAPTRTCR